MQLSVANGKEPKKLERKLRANSKYLTAAANVYRFGEALQICINVIENMSKAMVTFFIFSVFWFRIGTVGSSEG